MKLHRGEIFINAIRNKKPKLQITKAAEILGIDARTIYNYAQKEDLSLDFLAKANKLLDLNMIYEMPELTGFESQMVYEPETETYRKTNLAECMKQVDKWQYKYYKQVEINNELLLQLKNQ